MGGKGFRSLGRERGDVVEPQDGGSAVCTARDDAGPRLVLLVAAMLGQFGGDGWRKLPDSETQLAPLPRELLRERDGVEFLQRVEQHLALMRGQGLGSHWGEGFQAVESQVGMTELGCLLVLRKNRGGFG